MNENPLFETAKCTQLGILVHDIEKSSQAYAAFLGVPVPPVQMTGVYEDAHTTYLGQPTKARCKQAFFYYGDLEVELLEPDHEPSVWRQALDENGEGLHHVAFRVQGMDEMIRRGESQGMKLLHGALRLPGRHRIPPRDYRAAGKRPVRGVSRREGILRRDLFQAG